MGEIVKRLREQSLTKQGEAWRRQDGGQDLSIGAQLADDAADEIEALARFLQIALDIYEENFGLANTDRYPNDWTVQARKRLAALSHPNGTARE